VIIIKSLHGFERSKYNYDAKDGGREKEEEPACFIFPPALFFPSSLPHIAGTNSHCDEHPFKL